MVGVRFWATMAFSSPFHQKDAGLDARVAKSQAFGRIGDAEPYSAFGFESAGALDCSVAVAIGFDHGADRDVGADMFLHGVKVFAERGK